MGRACTSGWLAGTRLPPTDAHDTGEGPEIGATLPVADLRTLSGDPMRLEGRRQLLVLMSPRWWVARATSSSSSARIASRLMGARRRLLCGHGA